MAAKTEVDCQGLRHRDVYVITYGWGGNSVTRSEKLDEWQVAVPDTFAMRLIGLVCQGEVRDLLATEGAFLDVARATRIALERRQRR